jgi:hypothetical protein
VQYPFIAIFLQLDFRSLFLIFLEHSPTPLAFALAKDACASSLKHHLTLFKDPQAEIREIFTEKLAFGVDIG